MTDQQAAQATSNAQTAGKFLAEAIVAANNALYEGPEKIVTIKAEVEQHLDCARRHFDAMFSEIVAQ